MYLFISSLRFGFFACALIDPLHATFESPQFGTKEWNCTRGISNVFYRSRVEGKSTWLDSWATVVLCPDGVIAEWG